MPGVKYIIDKKENEEKGELLVSDPSLMIGYLNNKEETDRAIVNINGNRYMRMGDYFSADERDRALAYVFVDRIPETLMAKNDFSYLQKTCIEDLPYYPVDYDFLQST